MRSDFCTQSERRQFVRALQFPGMRKSLGLQKFEKEKACRSGSYSTVPGR